MPCGPVIFHGGVRFEPRNAGTKPGALPRWRTPTHAQKICALPLKARGEAFRQTIPLFGQKIHLFSLAWS